MSRLLVGAFDAHIRYPPMAMSMRSGEGQALVLGLRMLTSCLISIWSGDRQVRSGQQSPSRRLVTASSPLKQKHLGGSLLEAMLAVIQQAQRVWRC
jgi:hypothetical protein